MLVDGPDYREGWHPPPKPRAVERRVRDTVRLHAPVPPSVWPVLVSAGGAMLAPWDSGTLETLLGKADQEMHLRRSCAAKLARDAAVRLRRLTPRGPALRTPTVVDRLRRCGPVAVSGTVGG